MGIEVAEVGGAVEAAGLEAVGDPGEVVGTGLAWWWGHCAVWFMERDVGEMVMESGDI